MIAYVFWHVPGPGADVAEYERGMVAFHRRLAAGPPPGFRASGTLRLPPRPPQPWPEPSWLDGGGYEDWYLLEDFGDLDALNRAARDGARAGAHDAVAALSRHGAAGVYRLAAGPEQVPAGHASWWDKPPGVPYAAVGHEGAVQVWQRQLTLGPAPEFRRVHPSATPGTVHLAALASSAC